MNLEQNFYNKKLDCDFTKIIDVDSLKRPSVFDARDYAGASGNKESVLINDEFWFIKYPQNLKKREELKNVRVSYSNSSLTEYIGSHIYTILGFNAHKTLLGITNKRKHLVVLCKDFLTEDDKLIEYASLKNSKGSLTEDNEKSSSDRDIILEDVIKSFEEENKLSLIKSVAKKHFWSLFVIDSLIGNTDRNNGNWGVVKRKDGIITAPVYDNGACFNPSMSIEDMQECLNDINKLKDRAYKANFCVFKYVDNKGEIKPINQYQYILKMQNDDLNKAILNLVPIIKNKSNEIINFINSIPKEQNGVKIINNIQKQYYLTLIKTRYNEVLFPTYETLKGKTKAKGQKQDLSR